MKKVFLFYVLLGISSLSHSVAQTAREVQSLYNDLSVFEDALATQLKKGIKASAIRNIQNESVRQVAQQLLEKTYNTEYRIARYKALLSPTVLGQNLSIGDGYSKYENVTGVYLPLGKNIVIVDHIPADTHVKLLIPNWERRAPEGVEPTKDPNGWGLKKQEFSLRNGVNVIDVKEFGGLAYIDYFVNELDNQPEIAVHFLNAAVNGYFDNAIHSNADWDRLLENAVYPVLDAKGKHIQVAYPKEALKKYATGRGKDLINNYDSLVYRQHRLMGLEKYQSVPENRILARVNYNYYMFRDGDGVAYMGVKPGYAMGMVANPDVVIKGDPCWGFSHEVGHVHQLRPYFNWGGLGEVSNNLFSLYVTRSFGNKTRVSEQNNYQKSRDSIINRGISYLQDSDVFNRLIPFWQLQLYFEGVGSKPDFYADLFEAFRQQAKVDRTQGRTTRGGNWAMDRLVASNPAVYQLNFVRKACEVSQTDLTDFFDKYGFFYVGEIDIEDYGRYKYNMTQEMVDECKTAIKALNLPQPKVDITTLKD